MGGVRRPDLHGTGRRTAAITGSGTWCGSCVTSARLEAAVPERRAARRTTPPWSPRPHSPTTRSTTRGPATTRSGAPRLAEHELAGLGWHRRGRPRSPPTSGRSPTTDRAQTATATCCSTPTSPCSAANPRPIRRIHRRPRRVRPPRRRRVATGRAAVLGGLLGRPPLFASAPARARWEARARANVAAELAALGD